MSCNESYGFLSAADARKASRDNATIYEEICKIQGAILTAIDNKQFQTVVSNNTPMTGIGGIIGVNITNSGSQYTPISATASITHPNGSGAILSYTLNGGTINTVTVDFGGDDYEPIPATITGISRIPNINAILTPVETAGEITSITITNAGQGYHVGDDIIISHGLGNGATAEVSSIGSMGEITGIVITNNGQDYDSVGLTASVNRITATNATLSLNVNANTGAISSVTIVNGGTAYHIGDVVVISHPIGNGATVQVSNIGVMGQITGINVVTGGQDYQTIVATATITHPTGQGFVASVQVSNLGVVQSVTILNGGVGYNDLYPTITTSGTSGSGAIFNVQVGGVNDGITEVSIINKGSNYSNDTALTVVPAPTSIGSLAAVEPIIEEYNTGLVYYNVFAGLVTNREIKDQIDFVLDYFTRLGYNIKALANPSTMNTLQWQVSW